MCHKLLQVHACGHLKTICTTPCPHALETAHQIAHPNSEQDTSDLSRSSSIASSMAQSVRRSDLHNLPSQRRYSHTQHAPGQSSPLPHRHVPPPAFRFVPASQNPLLSPPSPGYPPQRSPTSPTSAFSRDSDGSNRAASPTTINHLPEEGGQAVEPNYCPYHFPRYLPQSPRPCLQCYMQPEWEDMRNAWIRKYREMHPYVKDEDLERMSGIAGIRERMDRGL